MFQILRTAKLTTVGNIAASGQHTFRERKTHNADSNRTHLNHGNGARCTDDLVKAINARLKTVDVKDDSVLCIEYLVTASPSWFSQKTEADRETYFADALRMLEQKHGKKNVVCSDVQLDEKTPHMVVYVVPIVEVAGIGTRKRSVKATAAEREATGKSTKIIEVANRPSVRLSAKQFLGGREKLSDLQTEFHEKVSAAHGLERGLVGSKATHIKLQSWYAQLEPSMQKAISVIDDAAKIEQKQKEREDSLIFKSTEIVKQAKAEADQLITDAKTWLKDAENDIKKREEIIKEQAGENEKLRLFLNDVAESLKTVFRKLPESVFLKLPDKMQDQLMRFFKITPIQKQKQKPKELVEATTNVASIPNNLSKTSLKLKPI